MPDKYLRADEALIGVGALIIRNLGQKKTFSELWDKIKVDPRVGSFERVLLAVDFLFLMGAIEECDNKIKLSRKIND